MRENDFLSILAHCWGMLIVLGGVWKFVSESPRAGDDLAVASFCIRGREAPRPFPFCWKRPALGYGMSVSFMRGKGWAGRARNSKLLAEA